MRPIFRSSPRPIRGPRGVAAEVVLRWKQPQAEEEAHVAALVRPTAPAARWRRGRLRCARCQLGLLKRLGCRRQVGGLGRGPAIAPAVPPAPWPARGRAGLASARWPPRRRVSAHATGSPIRRSSASRVPKDRGSRTSSRRSKDRPSSCSRANDRDPAIRGMKPADAVSAAHSSLLLVSGRGGRAARRPRSRAGSPPSPAPPSAPAAIPRSSAPS
jgi:hypothetical protein